MAQHTAIQWADATFNPWIGCTKVSAGCDNCYAEELDRRRAKLWGGLHWGPGVPRRLAADATWAAPVAWNRAQAKHEAACAERGIAPQPRPRVFCASLADVFDPEVPNEWRERLWALIDATPQLNWLVLTKRPQMMEKMLPGRWFPDALPPKANLWLGTTVENQDQANKRIPALLRMPAVVHFLSVEPMLEAVKVDYAVNWVICGGESGPGARPFNLAWAEDLQAHCDTAGVAFFMKQLGKRPYTVERTLDNAELPYVTPGDPRHGGDPEDWPPALRVRNLPAQAFTFPNR